MSAVKSELWHLMDDDVLDACGTAPEGEGLIVTPVKRDVNCPACRKIIDERGEEAARHA